MSLVLFGLFLKIAMTASIVCSPTVVLPVEFRRDSVATLARKTCAEFNTDLAYFRSAHPDKKLADMTVFLMSSGALFLTLPYGKFAHGVFRTASLLRHAVEKRQPNPIGLGAG